MTARSQDAAIFHALHRDFLILPNAWDAASAKLIERAGARAIATSSAAVAWAHGYADGHDLPIAKLVTTVEEIARVTALPITCDAEGGYADDPARVAENVAALIGAGAVGINLEDGRESHDLHLRKVEAARVAAERAGVALYINARTDVFLKKLVAPEQALQETIRRGCALKSAGASGYFVPFAMAPDDIRAIAGAVDLPLNIMGWPGIPDQAALWTLGARRLSAATWMFRAAASALAETASAFLRTGDCEALAGAADRTDFDALMRG
ncbi:MAG: isocitrate lyase/phosphoenolpyruvate mutase family protein [Terricaulis sp.]